MTNYQIFIRVLAVLGVFVDIYVLTHIFDLLNTKDTFTVTVGVLSLVSLVCVNIFYFRTIIKSLE